MRSHHDVGFPRATSVPCARCPMLLDARRPNEERGGTRAEPRRRLHRAWAAASASTRDTRSRVELLEPALALPRPHPAPSGDYLLACFHRLNCCCCRRSADT